MKKYLLSAVVLSVFASQAHATKARLEALGDDSLGSYFINDNRNIFLNPAYMNNFKSMATFEWGSAFARRTNATDGVATPRAEGGLNFKLGDYVLGTHLGTTSNTAESIRNLSSLGFLPQTNNIDVFFAGEMGFKWGLNVNFSGNKTDAAQGPEASPPIFGRRQNALGVKGGIIADNFEAFVHASIINKAVGSVASVTDEFKGKLGLRGGVTYQVQDWFKAYANYQHLTWDLFTAAQGVKTFSNKSLRMDLGLTRTDKLNEKARLFTRLAYVDTRLNVAPATGTATNTNTFDVPVVVGLEADALSWLVLRGSIQQSLLGHNQSGAANSNASTTKVNAGAGVKVGDVVVDALVGTFDPTGTTRVAGTNGASVGLGDGLLSRVSMTYNF